MTCTIKTLFIFLLLVQTVEMLPAQSVPIPHLQKQGTATQLVVKGKPFLALAGELHNSTVSSAAYMQPVWQQMKRKNLNTVLAPVYWEMIEPTEGKFDFTLVDSMIAGARKQELSLVILWFGVWKTTYPTYAPSWVKNDLTKYPRTTTKNGDVSPAANVFSSAWLQADIKAFKTLMQHVKEVDEKYQTVIMAQVENEIGLFGAPRDYSAAANKAWAKGVPADLMKYLVANKTKLQPEIDSAWKLSGYKTSGTWEEVFGKSIADEKASNSFPFLPEELFTTYYYTKFVGQLAAAGKEAYPIPFFVNAWAKGGMFSWPGKYPSGGPVPHTLDIWRANAPAIDILTPNIYAPSEGARYLIQNYYRAGNPILLPEFRKDADAANFAFFAYGQYDAMCFSPFGIDDMAPEQDPFTKTFGVLSQVTDLILQHQGRGTMKGIFVDTVNKSNEFVMNGYAIKATLTAPPPIPGFVTADKPATVAGGIVFALGPNEFIALGKDYELTFTPTNDKAQKLQVDVDYMEEGNFVNGKWEVIRRLNGDEGTGGGDIGGFGMKNTKVGSLRFQKNASGEYSIVKIKFYTY